MINIDDFWARYKTKQAACESRLPEIKTYVLDQLRSRTVHTVEIDYDGESDSGQINGIVGFDAEHKPVELTSLTAEPTADDHPLYTHLRQLTDAGSCSRRVASSQQGGSANSMCARVSGAFLLGRLGARHPAGALDGPSDATGRGRGRFPRNAPPWQGC